MRRVVNAFLLEKWGETQGSDPGHDASDAGVDFPDYTGPEADALTAKFKALVRPQGINRRGHTVLARASLGGIGILLQEVASRGSIRP